MLIAILGGLGFLCYLILNLTVSKDNETQIKQIIEIQLPVLEEITLTQSKLNTTRDLLANAIGLEDPTLLEEAQQLAHEINASFRQIQLSKPQLSEEVSKLEELFSSYFLSAYDISAALIADPRLFDTLGQTVILNQQKFTVIKHQLALTRDRSYDAYTRSLGSVDESIRDTITLGLVVGTGTILILVILAWTIANQVIKAIHKSDQLKDEFLATVSHELRTPMNGVNASLQLMRSNPLDAETMGYLDIATQSAQDMMDMVNGLLEYSEAKSNVLKPVEQPINLKSKITTVIKRHETKCLSKGLKFNFDLESVPDQYFLCDADRLFHILNILLDNAVKFTHEGKVDLNFKIEDLMEEHPRIAFMVTDTGIGIAKENHGKLFKSFRQVDGAFNRRHGGLGIGLATSMLLARSLGGNIEFESQFNQGSSFTLTVPISKIKDPNPLAPSVQNKTDNESNTTTPAPSVYSEKTDHLNTETALEDAVTEEKSGQNRSVKVLVVEDNPVNQKVLCAILKKIGFEAATANNGQEAVDFLDANTVDVVLMDCQMPVMDGFEATQRIRRGDSSNAKVPIIAVTANALAADREKCLQVGMNDYIKKPIDRAIIKLMLEKYLSSTENDESQAVS